MFFFLFVVFWLFFFFWGGGGEFSLRLISIFQTDLALNSRSNNLNYETHVITDGEVVSST